MVGLGLGAHGDSARAQVPVVCAGIAYITVEGAEMHSRVTLAALSVPTA